MRAERDRRQSRLLQFESVARTISASSLQTPETPRATLISATDRSERRGDKVRMSESTLAFLSLLSLVGYAAIANAELSAVERERLRLCPKNCAVYCEEI